MFSKIKDIKQKIKYAKYGAIAFAIIFVLQLIATGYLLFTVMDLKDDRVEVLTTQVQQ